MKENNTNTITVARNYYRTLFEKNRQELAVYLSDTIIFISPFAQLSDKESVINAALGFAQTLNNLTIRKVFVDSPEIVLILDFECPDPIGFVSGVSLITINNDLIERIELFYDARRFISQRQTIFAVD